MFRASYRRLGHQLIKEPMGHEETSLARGMRTKNIATNHVYGLAAATGIGCVAALYSFASAQRRVYMSVNSSGEMVKSTCPVQWWKY